ncbi:MAG: hypothetical protein LBT60_06670 [Oscillospiraceae bacterium]|nr:hypothetical protein [Oscillospiraceae bacterium]
MKRTAPWKLWIPAAACLALALAITVPLLTANDGGGDFDLARSDDALKVSYVNKVPGGRPAAVLTSLTEFALFNQYDTDIFSGTIKEVRNIRASYNGADDYRAIAQIEVGTVYRGNLAAGEVVSTLLPGPVSADTGTEDTDVTSRFAAGTTGIFMPLKYDETSFAEQNGVKLCLLDLAAYGFMDGERFAFLETEDELVFNRAAYPALDGARSLEDVAQYVQAMARHYVSIDVTRLDFASDDYLIFHDAAGLFVYDLNRRQMIRALDLEPIYCNNPDLCDVSVSPDGGTVILRPRFDLELWRLEEDPSLPVGDTMFVYTVADDTVSRADYTEMENPFDRLVWTADVLGGYDKVGYHSFKSVSFDDGTFGWLLTDDMTMGTLKYERGDESYILFQ